MSPKLKVFLNIGKALEPHRAFLESEIKGYTIVASHTDADVMIILMRSDWLCCPVAKQQRAEFKGPTKCLQRL